MRFLGFYQTSQLRYSLALCCIALSISICAFSQSDLSSTQVEGIVRSSETSQGLGGVNILIKNTSSGTISDQDGVFSITVAPNEVLVFSLVGFKSKEVKIRGIHMLEVDLEPSITLLEEIVKIGYGERERKDITGSISDLKAKDIEMSNAFSVEQSLQGQMPGVYVSGFSGNLNDRPRIFIRGMNTWGVTDPLIVIDGIPIKEYGQGAEKSRDGYYAGEATFSGGYVNIFNLINTLDIESYSVLKDASSAAVFGVNASNGVLLINTKRGEQGEPILRFNSSFGYTLKLQLPAFLNTQEYTELIQEGHILAGAPLPPEFNPDSVAYLGDSPTYNWLEEYYRDQALRSDVSLGVSGGNDNTDYYVGLGYNHREGAAVQNVMDRYSASVNLNSRINSWLRAGVNTKLAYAKGNDSKGTPGFGEYAESMKYSIQVPWQAMYNSETPPQWQGYEPPYDTVHVVNGYDELGHPIYSIEHVNKYGVQTTRDNYLALIDPELEENTFKSYRTLGSAYLEIRPWKSIYIKGRLMFDWTNTKETKWTSIHTIMFRKNDMDLKSMPPNSTEGKLLINNVTNHNLVGDLTIGYNDQFGRHHLDVLFNAMDQQYGAELSSSSTIQLTTDFKPGIYNFVGGENTDASASTFESALQGYLGRLSYHFDYKYYVDLSVRRDGSSRFAPENRWGTFPSASVAWRLSSEPFMNGVSWMKDLKLRAGWGQLGNQEVSPYAYFPTVTFTPKYRYGSGEGDPLGIYQYGVRIPAFPYRNLQWETSETLNLALDAYIFNGLNLTLEYYHKVTRDLLQAVDLPSYVGNEQDPLINVGSVLNKGFEFDLSYQGQIGSFRYMVGGNFSTIHNEVLETYNDQFFFVYSENRYQPLTFGIQEGYPVYFRRAYKAGGIFQNEDEVLQYQDSIRDIVALSKKPGDLWFYDISSSPEEGDADADPGPDGQVDSWDQAMVCKPLPGYYYGLRVQMSWKGWDLYGLFSGVGDYYKMNGWRKLGIQMTAIDNQFAEVKNRWTPDNPSEEMHGVDLFDYHDNSRASDYYLENAAYFKLANWQIGYDFKRLMPALASIDRMRLYLGGNNALIITDWSGVDPDSDMEFAQGIGEQRTPTLGRSFIIGLDLMF